MLSAKSAPICIARRQTIARSSFLSTVGPIVLATSLVPLSIALDSALDKARGRVESITNVDANGVRCFLTKDVIQETRPVVIVLHQLFGLEKREVDICEDLTKKGYVAIAVDLFDRRASRWLPSVLALAAERLFLPKEPDYGVDVVSRVTSWIERQSWFEEGTPIGIVGFCYGGGAAIRSALELPETFASVGIFYGNPPKTEEVSRLRCPVFAVYGNEDVQFPAEMIDRFERELRSIEGSEVRRFDGVGHAFVKDIEATEQPGPARDAWNGYLEFLDKVMDQRG